MVCYNKYEYPPVVYKEGGNLRRIQWKAESGVTMVRRERIDKKIGSNLLKTNSFLYG